MRMIVVDTAILNLFNLVTGEVQTSGNKVEGVGTSKRRQRLNLLY